MIEFALFLLGCSAAAFVPMAIGAWLRYRLNSQGTRSGLPAGLASVALPVFVLWLLEEADPYGERCILAGGMLIVAAGLSSFFAGIFACHAWNNWGLLGRLVGTATVVAVLTMGAFFGVLVSMYLYGPI